MPAKRTRPGNVIKAMGGTRGRGALKKTTRKGAYKNQAKKNFRIRRAPFVETKSRTTEDCVLNTTFTNPVTTEITIPKDDAFYDVDIQPFLSMEQGLGEPQMIGTSVYSRYVKLKMEFTFPSNANSLLLPYRLYVVHGWVKNTMGRTGTPQNIYGPTANATTYQGVKEFIVGNLKDYFNEKEDKLRFIPKHNPNLIIKGYKAIRPNRNRSIAMPQVAAYSDASASSVYTGAPPKVSHTATWQVNRKIPYQAGTVQSGQTNFFFPNQSYLPFAVIYTPDFADIAGIGDNYLPTVRWNCGHWYSDS